MTPELIKAIKQMDEYSKQARFLAKNIIETEEQLIEFEKNAYKRIKPWKSERENLWRAQKRAKTEDEKQIIEEMIVDISKKIAPLAEEMRICRCIVKRTIEIRKDELYRKLEKERMNVQNSLGKKMDKFR